MNPALPPSPLDARHHDRRPASADGPAVALDLRRAVRWLAVAIVGLLAMAVLGRVLHFTGLATRSYTVQQVMRVFEVDAEQSVPTWFSCLLLLAAAALLLLVGQLRRAARAPMARHWTALGAIFVLLSIDEVVGLHNTEFVSEETARGISDYFAIPWVFQGIAVVAVVGLAYLRFLVALPRATRRGFVLAGVIYVGGALVMEMVGASYIVRYTDAHPAVAAVVLVEEAMEMLGALVLVATLVRHLEAEYPRLGAHLARRPSSGERGEAR